nr:hypothetical protein [Trichocoleus sp. FACHB-90]
MSHEKIEKLTPEQEALIPVYWEKWRKIALSTEPIDRGKAKEAIKKIYALIGLPEPEILFFDSPCEAEKIFKYLLKEQQHYKVFSCEVSFKINSFQEKMWSQIMGYHPSELEEEILGRVVGGIPI